MKQLSNSNFQEIRKTPKHSQAFHWRMVNEHKRRSAEGQELETMTTTQLSAMCLLTH